MDLELVVENLEEMKHECRRMKEFLFDDELNTNIYNVTVNLVGNPVVVPKSLYIQEAINIVEYPNDSSFGKYDIDFDIIATSREDALKKFNELFGDMELNSMFNSNVKNELMQFARVNNILLNIRCDDDTVSHSLCVTEVKNEYTSETNLWKL